MKDLKVLITSVDAGAGENMCHLINLIGECHGIEILVCADNPSSKIFDHKKIVHKKLNFNSLLSRDKKLSLCHSIIDNFTPDIFIAGLSNSGNGLDEWMLSVVQKNVPNCKSFLLLDDKGPVISLEGAMADVFLSTTPAIFDWAVERNYGEVRNIGSLKYSYFMSLEMDKFRVFARKELGVLDEQSLITFVAQTDLMQGHNEGFEKFLRGVQEIWRTNKNLKLLVRGHPGAPNAGIDCYHKALETGIDCLWNIDTPIVEVLAASDVLVSCSSSALTDYVWLSSTGTKLNAKPIFLVGNALKKWLLATQKTWSQEIVEQGLGIYCFENDDITTLLINAISGTTKNLPEDKDRLKSQLVNKHTVLKALEIDSVEIVGN
jgi:hypothetical protein